MAYRDLDFIYRNGHMGMSTVASSARSPRDMSANMWREFGTPTVQYRTFWKIFPAAFSMRRNPLWAFMASNGTWPTWPAPRHADGYKSRSFG